MLHNRRANHICQTPGNLPKRLSNHWHKMGQLVCLAVASFALTGCIATAPIVNIPAQDGDIARHDPNAGNVINASVVALQAALDYRDYPGSVRIALPHGMSRESYDKIAAQLDVPGLLIPEDPQDASATVEVTMIRLRALEGAVDIVSPGRGDVPQLITVDLRYTATKGWQAHRVRPSSAPVRTSTLYMPAVESPTDQDAESSPGTSSNTSPSTSPTTSEQ